MTIIFPTMETCERTLLTFLKNMKKYFLHGDYPGATPESQELRRSTEQSFSLAQCPLASASLINQNSELLLPTKPLPALGFLGLSGRDAVFP